MTYPSAAITLLLPLLAGCLAAVYRHDPAFPKIDGAGLPGIVDATGALSYHVPSCGGRSLVYEGSATAKACCSDTMVIYVPGANLSPTEQRRAIAVVREVFAEQGVGVVGLVWPSRPWLPYYPSVEESAAPHVGAAVLAPFLAVVAQRCPGSRVFLIGHSAGAGVVVHGLEELARQGRSVDGVVLLAAAVDDRILENSVALKATPWLISTSQPNDSALIGRDLILRGRALGRRVLPAAGLVLVPFDGSEHSFTDDPARFRDAVGRACRLRPKFCGAAAVNGGGGRPHSK